MVYNPGNYQKYTTKNILKKKMVDLFNNKIVSIVQDAVNGQNQNNEEISKSSPKNNLKISILDAGCGEGFMSGFLYEKLGDTVEITGLEYTAEALEIAKKANPKIKYIQGDIMDMPFASDNFDIVLCTEVLEHLSDPTNAVKELERVTKGTLILSVPNEPWFCMGNLLALKNISRLGNPIDHINHWTYSSFKKFLKTNSNQNWIMDSSFPWTIAKYENSKI